MRIGVLAFVGGLATALPASAKAPVLVELYTSQGCGTCAESSRVIDRLSMRKDVLALTFSVDTWDYLGWTDTFARPEFAARQRACAENREPNAVYTPQVIVGGVGEARANETRAVDGLVRRAQAPAANSPAMRFIRDGALVQINSGPTPVRPDEVWLIRYEPGVREVEVRRGENQGRTLAYRNVVRELVKLGEWNGRARGFDLPRPSHEGLTTLVIVQKVGCDKVMAAAVR